MSDEVVTVIHDPNYKWRVLGAISIVFFTAFAVSATAIWSSALSSGIIAGLFGMEFAIVLIVALLVLRYPSADPRGFTMDNPWISVPFSCLSGVLTSLFLQWLGSR